jgi:hypothetical protein
LARNNAIPFTHPNQGRIKVNKEQVNEIEIALQTGAIKELTTMNENSVQIMLRLTNHIKGQDEIIDQWELQNETTIKALSETIEKLNKARNTAIRLEQECHSCADIVHHGNEEAY